MTREKYEKKEKRNKIIIGVVLIMLMVGSTAGYAVFSIIGGNDEEDPNLRGIEFALGDDNLWYFNVEGQEFSSVYNPLQTKDVLINTNITLEDYSQKPLFFSHDSVREGIDEIARNIQGNVERTQFVCIDECEENLPLKDCSDNIIIIKEGNETLIKQDGNCIYIIGKKEEIIKASDAFLFKLLDVEYD